MNPSVVAFRAACQAMPTTVAAKLAYSMYHGVHKIAEDMRESVPVHEGTLRDTIEVHVISPLHLLITAGGEATTKTSPSGWEYDYALAVEYGTSKMDAQPFFWPSYQHGSRLMLAGMVRSVILSFG